MRERNFCWIIIYRQLFDVRLSRIRTIGLKLTLLTHDWYQ